MHVYMFIFVYTHMCASVCVCESVCRQDVDVGCLSQLFSPLVFETIFLTGLEAH